MIISSLFEKYRAVGEKLFKRDKLLAGFFQIAIRRENAMDFQQNPFESPKADISIFSQRGPGGDGNARSEQVRREYLGHEASVKSVGILYYFSAACVAVASVMSFASLHIIASSMAAAVGAFLFVLSAALGIVGYGLQKLESWVRIPVALLGGLGIMGAINSLMHPPANASPGSPVGTMIGMAINIYIIQLVWSAKGKFVCSEEYRTIIAETPHIKYRTPLIIKILGGLLLFIIGLGILALLLSGPSGRR